MYTLRRLAKVLTVAIAAIIFSLPCMVSADTVQITTLTKPGGVMANIAYDVSEGFAFTTDGSPYVLNKICVSLSTTTSSGYTGELKGDLYITDSLGRPFGSSLGTFSTTDTIGDLFSQINFIPDNPITLSANTQYSFALSTTPTATRNWVLEFTSVSNGYDLPNGGNWSMYAGRSFLVDGVWGSEGYIRVRTAISATPIPTKGGNHNHFGQQRPPALSLPATLGGNFSSAVAINQRGQILLVGNNALYGAQHTYVVGGGSLQDVGNLGGDFADGIAINNKGQVAGISVIEGDWRSRAFLFSNGTMKDLSISPDWPNAAVTGLNDDGSVVGYFASLDWSRFVSFVYSNGTTKLIGDFGGNYTFAQSINSKGQVVGGSNGPGDTWTHAFLYSNGVTVDLGGLGGSYSSATAINSKGQIAGYGTIVGDLATHPFLVDKGVMRDLGLPSGWSGGFATGINEHGDVVGTLLNTDNSQRRTFLYKSGVIKELIASADWAYSYSSSMNENGEVVGFLAKSDWSQISPWLYSDGELKELSVAYANLLSDGTRAGFTALSFANAINKDGIIVGNGQYFDGMDVTSTQAFMLDTKAHSLKKLK